MPLVIIVIVAVILYTIHVLQYDTRFIVFCLDKIDSLYIGHIH